MAFFINDTGEYHKQDIETLAWELTVCNTLEFEDGPARRILSRNATYGEHLADFLFSHIDETTCGSFVEIGGGYGFVARDLLKRNPGMEAAMIDISPMLLGKQKKTLADFDVRFLLSDFFDVEASEWKRHDLAILNEIAGDFPTACNLTRKIIEDVPDNAGHPLESAKRYLDAGLLRLPDSEPFHVNVGALEAVEALCSIGVPAIFFSEHSCEADASDQAGRFLPFFPGRNPEEIKLAGHSEYSICFSNIEALGKRFGYRTIRGNYTDFIRYDFSPKVRYILTSGSCKDEHEIIRQFIHDLYKYEYLLLLGQS